MEATLPDSPEWRKADLDAGLPMLLMSIVCKFATATSAIASKPVTAGERVGIEGFSFPFCLDWPAMTALVASLGGITWGPATCDDVGVSVALGTCEGVVAGSSVAGASAGGDVALAGVAAATASAGAGVAVGCFADFGGAVADSAVVVSVVVPLSVVVIGLAAVAVVACCCSGCCCCCFDWQFSC